LIYLLDTNIAIAVLKDAPGKVRERFLHAHGQDQIVCLSAIVLFELWFGVAKSGHWEKNSSRLREFLSLELPVIEFDEADAQTAAEIRQSLRKTGKPIGPYDLLIAAQALRRNAVLVTANTREFSHVAGLQWEDWSKS
jgi:tRNA(fMet)-specific endonuclease VapC